MTLRVPRSAMGLGADVDTAAFGHRTHVARPFGAPKGWRLAEGHMVANTSVASSAASVWPTGGRAEGPQGFWILRTHIEMMGVSALFEPRTAASAAKGLSTGGFLKKEQTLALGALRTPW